MTRSIIIFTANREGRRAANFLVMENNEPPHELYWGNRSNQYRRATLQQR
jgi:hypothetical protein